ncbi:MAG: gas vesicle protein GvpD [Candidatus Diapherotrites archaeon]|nr:gas vesicle protein GvpD [Candidatus Diapherotrites archaeon]
MAEIERVKFGIQGLDKALNGGIPKGNLVLLSGGAGTGKTTFSLQFLINGALLFGEKGLYISTEQSVQELRKAASTFGWKLEDLEKAGLIRIRYLNILKGDSFLKNIKVEAEDFQPKRIVIDSLTTLTDTMLVTDLKDDIAFSVVQVAETVNPFPRTERMIAKTILYHLIGALRDIDNATVMLTSELLEGEKGLSADAVSEFICDGVIIVALRDLARESVRSVRVRKMRNTAHSIASLLFDMTPSGVVVKTETVFEGEKISGIIPGQ